METNLEFANFIRYIYTFGSMSVSVIFFSIKDLYAKRVHPTIKGVILIPYICLTHILFRSFMIFSAYIISTADLRQTFPSFHQKSLHKKGHSNRILYGARIYTMLLPHIWWIYTSHMLICLRHIRFRHWLLIFLIFPVP